MKIQTIKRFNNGWQRRKNNLQIPVSVQDKKGFIQWFLNQYQLKKRESVWILNYLVNHDHMLKNVHFIREARFCPRAIIMSTQCTEEVPFRFYKSQLITTDPEKTFHEIRLNQKEPLYIQLNFQAAEQNAVYAAVLEENPFVPDECFISPADRKLVQELLDKLVFDYQRSLLYEDIDKALDEKNKQKFNQLSKQLHKLDQAYFNQPKLLQQ